MGKPKHPESGSVQPDLKKFLANLDYLFNEFERAAHYQDCLPLAKHRHRVTKQLGKFHPEFVESLERLGTTYLHLGNFRKAGTYFRQMESITRRTQGNNPQAYAKTLERLGCLFRTMGDHKRAEYFLGNALTVFETVKDSDLEIAEVRNQLGVVSREIGDYPKALFHFSRASFMMEVILKSEPGKYSQEVMIEASDLQASCLNYLGSINREKRQYTIAERCYKDSLKIRRAILGTSHPQFLRTLNGLAMLYDDTEKYKEAERCYKEMLKIAETNNLPDLPIYLENIGRHYLAVDEYAKAEAFLKKALDAELQNEASGAPITNLPPILHGLAQARAAVNTSEAIQLAEQAEKVQDRIIQYIFSMMSENQRIMFMRRYQNGYDSLLSLAIQRPTDEKAVAAGADLVLRRKGILAELLAIERQEALAVQSPTLKRKIAEQKRLRLQIAQARLPIELENFGLMRPRQRDNQFARQVMEWISEAEQLEREIAAEIPLSQRKLALDSVIRNVEPDKIAASIGEDAALLEFVRLNVTWLPGKSSEELRPRYFAFVILGKEPTQVRLVDLGEAQRIDDMIAEFRKTIQEEIDPSQRNNGSALRAAVFDPLIQAIGDCVRLFIAPDGQLTRLPFQVLPAREGGYLIDRYHFYYLGTGREILDLDRAPGDTTSPLIIASPDFDLAETGLTTERSDESLTLDSSEMYRSLEKFDSLVETKGEGELVAQILGVDATDEQNYWTGPAALETRLKKCHSPVILHIATHGFFLENVGDSRSAESGVDTDSIDTELGTIYVSPNPMLRSGLALAGANTFLKGGSPPKDAEDGILTAADIMGLDLSYTELVVLSACETGLGAALSGEGVLGLRRAFTLAGARTLVMSLWKVKGIATQELMKLFYANLLSGKPDNGRADALRNAQLTMKSRQEYSDPFYWGAFISQGSPAYIPIVKSTSEMSFGQKTPMVAPHP